jgi:methylated-DNA-[protein]-cysteine S-methyltransferase
VSADRYHLFDTAHGFAAITWTRDGLTAFRLPAPTATETERALLRRLPDARVADPSEDIAGIITSVRRYFLGERIDFGAVPVALGVQEPFFARIYHHIRELGWGETTTYGAVAKSLGVGPEMARAVGQAMARNPVPLIVPCHRVLAAGGRIGGFSAPGGSNAKVRMLALEGVAPQADVPPAPTNQQSFAF